MGGLVASLLFQPPPPGMGAIFATPESKHFWYARTISQAFDATLA
jgi:hypothetical protein